MDVVHPAVVEESMLSRQTRERADGDTRSDFGALRLSGDALSGAKWFDGGGDIHPRIDPRDDGLAGARVLDIPSRLNRDTMSQASSV
jgi:hypothetical protein